MADLLKDWVRDIFIIVTGLCFAEIVLPKGNMKKYLKFIFSIMILGVVLSPISFFMEEGSAAEAFSGEYDVYIETEDNNTGSGLEEVQSVQLEEIYKEKIRNEAMAAVVEVFPEINIYEIRVYLGETATSKGKEPAYLNKIVIKGEETEYVSNIIRCVSQRLGIHDSMVSYEVPKENHRDE